MPTAHNGPLKLNYTVQGDGYPLLLIMGLGVTATTWWRSGPVLAEQGFRVISFDNRGMGRSGRVPGPYTTSEMADDAIAVLDAAGAARAHVYGFSLGGMIAQQVALRHPERVMRLVLGGSSAGGDGAMQPPDDAIAFLQRKTAMPAEEAVWASVPYNYGARTRRERAQLIGEDIERRLQYPVESESYSAQLSAVLTHDVADSLGEINAPTLVVHGQEDRLLHPDNAAYLARNIPNATTEIVSDAGHFYFTDEPTVDATIAGFLRAGEPM